MYIREKEKYEKIFAGKKEKYNGIGILKM